MRDLKVFDQAMRLVRQRQEKESKEQEAARKKEENKK